MSDRCADCRNDPCRCPATLYLEQMGKPPPTLPEGDPLAWQWNPRLTRRELRNRIAGTTEDDDGPPAVIEGQESLL